MEWKSIQFPIEKERSTLSLRTNRIVNLGFIEDWNSNSNCNACHPNCYCHYLHFPMPSKRKNTQGKKKDIQNRKKNEVKKKECYKNRREEPCSGQVR